MDDRRRDNPHTTKLLTPCVSMNLLSDSLTTNVNITPDADMLLQPTHTLHMAIKLQAAPDRPTAGSAQLEMLVALLPPCPTPTVQMCAADAAAAAAAAAAITTATATTATTAHRREGREARLHQRHAAGRLERRVGEARQLRVVVDALRPGVTVGPRHAQRRWPRELRRVAEEQVVLRRVGEGGAQVAHLG